MASSSDKEAEMLFSSNTREEDDDDNNRKIKLTYSYWWSVKRLWENKMFIHDNVFVHA